MTDESSAVEFEEFDALFSGELTKHKMKFGINCRKQEEHTE